MPLPRLILRLGGLFTALLAGPAAAQQHYQLTPAVLDLAGGRGTSANYTADDSSAPGTAGNSTNYSLRSGFTGQLVDAVSIALSASPATVNETASRPLAAALIFDDSTQSPVVADSVSWSVLSGPVVTITGAGLATAGVVAEDSLATVRGAFNGFSGTLTLTVVDSMPDNFGVYAGDGLPDAWQVQQFGPASLQGGPNANPDHDVYDNLHEFAFGTDPRDPGSGAGSAEILYNAGVVTRRGPPVMRLTGTNEFEVIFARRKETSGLSYAVQFSNDLETWINIRVPQVVVATDAELEAVKLTFPFSLPADQTRRFFRVIVTRLN